MNPIASGSLFLLTTYQHRGYAKLNSSAAKKRTALFVILDYGKETVRTAG
jgi:hypothetical protein